MVKLRQSSRSLVFSVFKKGAALLGCLFFLLSMILPFCLINGPVMYYPIPTEYSTYYWSFRSLNRILVGTKPALWTDRWFLNCWLHDDLINRLGLSNIFITLCAVQILTLITGIVSIFVKKSRFAVIPTTLCFTVILMMTYTSGTLSSTAASDIRQLGYWLAYPSMFLFLFSSIVGMVSKKDMKITSATI